MNAQLTASPAVPEAVEEYDEFVAMLPKIKQRLRREFWKLRAEAADEAVSEGVANSYRQYAMLRKRGRAGAAFPSALAKFAARQVRAGRKVGGSLNINEPLSDYAQVRRGWRRLSLASESASTASWAEAALADHRTSVPERVALRIDVPQWLQGLAVRMRRIAQDLAIGCTTGEVAAKYGLTAGRISQIRLELYNSWLQFHGESVGA